MAQTVKSLPVVQETWVRSLGWEDPLEEEIATHSNILAWRIPWTEDRQATVHGVAKESIMIEQLTLSFTFYALSISNTKFYYSSSISGSCIVINEHHNIMENPLT